MYYQIATLKYYYSPDLQGDEQPRIDETLYDTIDEAKDVIADWDDGTYVLDHNEYARPTYVVVESVDAYYIASGRNEDMSNYDWGDAEHDCGECGICLAMMIDQDRQYLLDHAVYKS